MCEVQLAEHWQDKASTDGLRIIFHFAFDNFLTTPISEVYS